MATGSGRSGNKDVAGTASKAFTRWLHNRQGRVECHSYIAYLLDTLSIYIAEEEIKKSF